MLSLPRLHSCCSPAHHSPCAQSVYDATQKAPARFCLSLLQHELNFATLPHASPAVSAFEFGGTQ